MSVDLKRTGYFIDTSELQPINDWRSAINGVTTNPVILAKGGVLNVPERLGEICKIVGPGVPVSVEIPDTNLSELQMIEMARELHAQFLNNAVIKVPLTPEPKPFNVLSQLARENIPTNATLGLTFAQLALAASAGADYISMFWGRVSESHDNYKEGPDPETLLEATLTFLLKQGLPAKVIIGSIRTPDHIMQAFSLGAHIVTVPPQRLQESFTNRRLGETIEEFNDAYASVKDQPGFKIV